MALADDKVYEKVRDVVEAILPAMAADAGGLTIVQADAKQVVLRLLGACRYCPSQSLTISRTIIPALTPVLPRGCDLIIQTAGADPQ